GLGGDGELPAVQRDPRCRAGREHRKVVGEVLAGRQLLPRLPGPAGEAGRDDTHTRDDSMVVGSGQRADPNRPVKHQDGARLVRRLSTSMVAMLTGSIDPGSGRSSTTSRRSTASATSTNAPNGTTLVTRPVTTSPTRCAAMKLSHGSMRSPPSTAGSATRANGGGAAGHRPATGGPARP